MAAATASIKPILLAYESFHAFHLASLSVTFVMIS